MEPPSTWAWIAQALVLAVPLTFGVAALRCSRSAPFRSAMLATPVALALSILATSALMLGAASPGAGHSSMPVRVDSVTAAMLVLVSGLGLVIVRYSRSYLRGDPGQLRYAQALLTTLAAVTTLVGTSHLLILAGAWTATSLGLHTLLTFYGNRTAALVAAHKKFLVSRLADGCLWSAFALIHHVVGSLDLDALETWTRTQPVLPAELQVAAILCVIAASLKCAQLPFHGWLTQVMEAPTPVSALLHAGVVNLGGFLMIRLSPLMAKAPAAQLLLVVIGMTTTVIAALVMSTRVSVKVSLAWSTCAQMGFMLAECGLGAWHLALLHLVAHSLYKAHAFLNAGSAVDTWRIGALSPRLERPSLLRLTGGTVAVLTTAGGTVALHSRLIPADTTDRAPVYALALLVGLSVVPLVTRPTVSLGAGAIRAAGVSLLYVLGHGLAERMAAPLPTHVPSAFGWSVVASGFVALFFAQWLLVLRPHGALSSRLHTWLFAGLYLDEAFTRLTFRIWPPRLPPQPPTFRAGVIAPVEIGS